MGVLGLTTFVKRNERSYLKDFQLQDGYLVVDGKGICKSLYRNFAEAGHLSAFGGDYDKYSMYVEDFFKYLRKCNVTPLVVIDESWEKNKFETVCERRSEDAGKISCLQIEPFNPDYNTLPILLNDVFIEVLIKLNIQYTISIFEADKDIASLAQNLQCGVLAMDSDFYIYNINYIPYDMGLNLKKSANGNFFMKCKMYRVDSLTKKDKLPLLSLLLGNDYVDNKIFDDFYMRQNIQPKSHQVYRKKRNVRPTDRLLNWLETESFDSAVQKIIDSITNTNEKRKMMVTINDVVASYKLDESCDIIKYFDIPDISKLNISNSQEPYKTDSESSLSRKGSNSTIVPEWFKKAIKNNEIRRTHIKMYIVKHILYSPQAENTNEEDAYLNVLPILRYAFDMLFNSSDEQLVYMSRDRYLSSSKSCLKAVQVTKEFSVDRPFKVSYPELNKEQKKMLFTHFLKTKLPDIDFDVIGMLPSDFQLQIISMFWWIKNCKVYSYNVLAIIITYEMMIVMLDLKLNNFINLIIFHSVYSHKILELKSKESGTFSDDDQNSVPIYHGSELIYEDCLLAADSLLKYFEFKKRNYNIDIVHSFAQLQCCLMELNYLNSLCGLPFESTKYSKINGTFMYNLALELKGQENPLQFVMQLFNNAKSAQQFFSGIYGIYKKCEQKMKLTTN